MDKGAMSREILLAAVVYGLFAALYALLALWLAKRFGRLLVLVPWVLSALLFATLAVRHLIRVGQGNPRSAAVAFFLTGLVAFGVPLLALRTRLNADPTLGTYTRTACLGVAGFFLGLIAAMGGWVVAAQLFGGFPRSALYR